LSGLASQQTKPDREQHPTSRTISVASSWLPLCPSHLCAAEPAAEAPRLETSTVLTQTIPIDPIPADENSLVHDIVPVLCILLLLGCFFGGLSVCLAFLKGSSPGQAESKLHFPLSFSSSSFVPRALHSRRGPVAYLPSTLLPSLMLDAIILTLGVRALAVFLPNPLVKG
jgi:hypothetical protein